MWGEQRRACCWVVVGADPYEGEGFFALGGGIPPLRSDVGCGGKRCINFDILEHTHEKGGGFLKNLGEI